jgi:sRNA-binding regulator protein Hfq
METGKSAPVNKLRGYGPESRMFDEMKGCMVCISWKNGEAGIRATLLWVDRYTLGLRLQNGYKVMVYKDAIKTIEPGDQKGIPQL